MTSLSDKENTFYLKIEPRRWWHQEKHNIPLISIVYQQEKGNTPEWSNGRVWRSRVWNTSSKLSPQG